MRTFCNEYMSKRLEVMQEIVGTFALGLSIIGVPTYSTVLERLPYYTLQVNCTQSYQIKCDFEVIY